MISQHYITVTPIFMPSERDLLNVSFTYGAIFIDGVVKRVHSAKIFPFFTRFPWVIYFLCTAHFYLLIELLWNFYDFSLSVQSAQIQQYQSHSNVSTSQYFFFHYKFINTNNVRKYMASSSLRNFNWYLFNNKPTIFHKLIFMIIDWLSCCRYR